MNTCYGFQPGDAVVITSEWTMDCLRDKGLCVGGVYAISPEPGEFILPGEIPIVAPDDIYYVQPQHIRRYDAQTAGDSYTGV